MYTAYEDSLTFSLKSTVSTTSEQGDKNCMHTQQRLDQVFMHHKIRDGSLSPSPSPWVHLIPMDPCCKKLGVLQTWFTLFFFFFFKTWLILSMCERSSPLKVLHLYHACSWLSGLADLLLELYQRGNTALCTLLSARCGVDRPAQLESQVDQFHILKGDGDCRLPVTLRVHQS